MSGSIAFAYSGEDNKLLCPYDEVFISLVVYKDKSVIEDYIAENISSPKELKDSMALVAYLDQNEDIDKNIVALLLKSGVNPNTNIFSRIPLHQIYHKAKKPKNNDKPPILGDIDSVTVENLDDYFKLYEEFMNRYNLLPDYIDLLLSYGANINIINDNGDTLLKEAVFRSDINTIKLLIAKGASVLVQDNYGSTALSKLFWKISDDNEDKDDYTITDVQKEMIELLDKTAREEMDKLGILSQHDAAIQNWRCDYFSNDRNS